MDRRAWRATVHEVTIVEHDWMTEHTHMHNHIGVCVRVCVCVCVCVGFPGVASCTEPIHQCRRHNRHRFDSWVEKIPWRRAWQPTPLFLPGEFHGQRSLAGVANSKTWLNNYAHMHILSLTLLSVFWLVSSSSSHFLFSCSLPL